MTRLSDDTVLCQDFTVASLIDDVGRLRAIQKSLHAFEDSGELLTRQSLNASLEDLGEETLPVTEFNALMSCLSNAGAAFEEIPSSMGYADYTFSVNVEKANRVLDQQIIVVTANNASASNQPETNVEVVATVPAEVDSDVSQLVGRTSVSLRKLVMEAESEVRVANPFFDPQQRIVNDLAALPKRGVETKILTREAAGEEVADKTLDTITELVKDLDNEEIERVSVRDFYHTTESGSQLGAIHAKLVIVDESKCYIGSANLTELNLRGNFEIGVILTGESVSTVLKLFDTVFHEADTVPL